MKQLSLAETGFLPNIKDLNNIVEQDHRAVTRITKPMMGFKSFRAAYDVQAGIELMHMIRKGRRSSRKEMNSLSPSSFTHWRPNCVQGLCGHQKNYQYFSQSRSARQNRLRSCRKQKRRCRNSERRLSMTHFLAPRFTAFPFTIRSNSTNHAQKGLRHVASA